MESSLFRSVKTKDPGKLQKSPRRLGHGSRGQIIIRLVLFCSNNRVSSSPPPLLLLLLFLLRRLPLHFSASSPPEQEDPPFHSRLALSFSLPSLLALKFSTFLHLIKFNNTFSSTFILSLFLSHHHESKLFNSSDTNLPLLLSPRPSSDLS